MYQTFNSKERALDIAWSSARRSVLLWIPQIPSVTNAIEISDMRKGTAVEGIDKFCVRLRGHDQRSAVAVELSNQHTFVIACQF
jgi:hypothetical protein